MDEGPRMARQPEEGHGTERRQSLRVPITVIRARIGDGPGTFFGYAYDISRDGLGIRTLSPKAPGTRYRLEFDLPPPLSLTVVCHCEVVWTRRFAESPARQPGMGIRFLDLSPETAEAISRWIREAAWDERLGV